MVWPEGSLFNRYYTKVLGKATLISQISSILSLIPYLMILRSNQRGIKYQFLSFSYDTTWNWTLVSWSIGKTSFYNYTGSF